MTILVPNWRQALRWYSVQAMLLGASLHEGWSYLPEDLKRLVPDHLGKHLATAVLLLGVSGRLVSQELKLKDFSSLFSYKPKREQRTVQQDTHK